MIKQEVYLEFTGTTKTSEPYANAYIKHIEVQAVYRRYSHLYRQTSKDAL